MIVGLKKKTKSYLYGSYSHLMKGELSDTRIVVQPPLTVNKHLTSCSLKIISYISDIGSTAITTKRPEIKECLKSL